MNKKQYVLDFRTLKFYLAHGMVLRKIHKGIKYHQCAWMAPYIALNQEKREQALTPFKKDFHKVMKNSVYGKTCENQKKRTSIYLVINEQQFRRLVAKPQFMDARIHSEDLRALGHQKCLDCLQLPPSVGFCILELANLNMYRKTHSLFSLAPNFLRCLAGCLPACAFRLHIYFIYVF